MMRIWNPSHFTIGNPGRSNCPRWRGQDFSFEPAETKDVTDLCGKWLISAYGYYGLVSLPDKNYVTDEDDYNTAIDKARDHGIRQLYKWAARVVDQYRTEYKKCIDARERGPKPNNFVKQASKICKQYKKDVLLSDPEIIEDQNLIREIMGGLEHDSDKLIENALGAEIEDAQKNVRQYSNEDAPVDIPNPNVPGEPKKETGTKVLNKPGKKKDRGGKRTNSKPVAPATMDNMNVMPDLDAAANR